MKKGIKSLGAYLPYHYLTRAALGQAWGGRGGKGEKSVADVDEDSVTMAVEAAMGCFRFAEREAVNTLYFASTTGPYAEKAHASLIAVALDLKDEDIFAADVMGTTRAGTNALKAALDSAAANPGESVLVTAADARNGFPKSAQESGFGDGAAAVVVGTGDDLLAENFPMIHAVGGSWTVPKKEIAAGNFEAIAALCAEARKIVDDARA